MVLSSFFGVVRCVGEVPVRDVRVVAPLHMVPCLMMFRGFAVMLGRMLVVLGCFVMMRSAFVMVHGRQFSFGDRIGTWIRRVSGSRVSFLELSMPPSERWPVQIQAYDPPNSIDNQMNSR